MAEAAAVSSATMRATRRVPYWATGSLRRWGYGVRPTAFGMGEL
jgi:hypothetical protein